jgi:hypothetical protein
MGMSEWDFWLLVIVAALTVLRLEWKLKDLERQLDRIEGKLGAARDLT